MARPNAPPPPPANAGGAYFDKKGEVNELRTLLRSVANDKDPVKKREAIKKVIAYMTLGIDVSRLFSDMVMASCTNDLVQKKMIYLYLVNYAESNPELAILAVNTLQKDCRDDDPLIRGLALRSLCSLKLGNMVEYLEPAIRQGLKDMNGYVRKTAVLGVVKLYHIDPQAVAGSDFPEVLTNMLGDRDGDVVCNAMIVLDELMEESGGYPVDRGRMIQLMNRLSTFSEWGQNVVLNQLSKFVPQVTDEGEMFDVMNVLDNLLKQSSAGVIVSVVKVFMQLTEFKPDLQRQVLARVKAPLLTMLSTSQPELAYTVALHIHVICARNKCECADLFSSEADYKNFFCRYSDPSYLKAVKLQILTVLGSTAMQNVQPIVAELSEYVSDVDNEIARKAICAIGDIAMSPRLSTERPDLVEGIVDTLRDFLKLQIEYVSTEAMVQMKDLVRKFPQYANKIVNEEVMNMCLGGDGSVQAMEEEGQCAVLWMLGEYAEWLEEAPYMLEPLVKGFSEQESAPVRLELLTVALKIFMRRPAEMQPILGLLLQKAISECNHPDVRDRALLYYRMLRASFQDTKECVLSGGQVSDLEARESNIERIGRDLEDFNTLCLVFGQPAHKFLPEKEKKGAVVTVGGDATGNGAAHGAPAYEDHAPPAPAPPSAPAPPAAPQGMMDLMSDDVGVDLLDGFGGGAPAAPSLSLVERPSCEPAAFQSKWADPNAATMTDTRSLTVQGVSASILEGLFGAVGIASMASGTVGGETKMYLYAQQNPGGPAAPLFMIEVVVTPASSKVQVTLKSSGVDNALSASFLRLVWQQLEPVTT